MKSENAEQALMREQKYRRYFMDPDGKGFETLIDSIKKMLPTLKVWWLGENPKVQNQDLKEKKEKLHTYIKNSDFTAKDSQLVEFFERILVNLKFNRRNFINIHPSPFLPSILASFMVSLQNPNNITEHMSPATTSLEKECIDFYKQLIGYPSDSWGTLVSDGTLANLTAMLVARDEKYKINNAPQKELLGKEGLYSKKSGVIITTTNAHYSIEKCIWILGMGTQNLIKIPVAIDESRFKSENLLEEDRFEKLDEPDNDSILELKNFYEGKQEPFALIPRKQDFEKTLNNIIENQTPIIAIITTAGTTQTGTLENITELVELKSNYATYFHVDAAIGGYALCIPEIKRSLQGIKNADSVTIDGHKLGFLHYPCGAIIFKKQNYKELIEHTAPYLHELSPTIEGSRPGTHAAACWLAHRILAEEGYRNIIENLLNQTKYLATRLKEEDKYQIYHKIHLNTIVFGLQQPEVSRKKINQWNLQIVERINGQGKFLVSSTQTLSDIKVRNTPNDPKSELVDIHGIRILLMNPYTDDNTIEEFIAELNKATDLSGQLLRIK
ncbi:MAG TPA: pyridoxal-dependent decarboxylase [Candidatus Deferrimicrobium sp.]|nr:pyridoxal-dependent decarboxylase [Candidatus Deferrimicrobium sp.]